MSKQRDLPTRVWPRPGKNTDFTCRKCCVWTWSASRSCPNTLFSEKCARKARNRVTGSQQSQAVRRTRPKDRGRIGRSQVPGNSRRLIHRSKTYAIGIGINVLRTRKSKRADWTAPASDGRLVASDPPERRLARHASRQTSSRMFNSPARPTALK
jgi:hypothetical protein